MFQEGNQNLTPLGQFNMPHAHTVAVDPKTHLVYFLWRISAAIHCSESCGPAICYSEVNGERMKSKDLLFCREPPIHLGLEFLIPNG